ncbi:NADH-quinone oxidoreductase subunit 9 [Slackia heliotrinireducens]|uniref:NADH:ubiquinone oxidoreductase chain I-like protein n=1 Tax=Slackia heliotrinireducens (strain ATCC 29202 / DSM 20476 / NCTC 11029 / RHS 1) TaxID=471855 RepID=C7N627_SLAHD|nr:4Fe-4S dicluster domain-containing protein [Slackia heliotrinireducens]ACV22362.1 NADH:ubiquinone oxidoreductase chain I-like protein [Slackia heliotrinireducens DSM 20476]VEH00637.1 NADH-quinone oxidoreductase subunit 9 [Slackia heliotrinireducens]
MGSFKLGKMTMRSLFGTPETVLYPVVEPKRHANTRGHIENHAPQDCILCGICMKKCPANAIVVSKPERTWTIDPFRCIRCNECAIACPKQCLSMHMEKSDASKEHAATVVEIPESEKDREKRLAAEARKAEAAKAAPATAPAASADESVQLSPEMEAKIAAMPPEKAAKFRAACIAKAKKEQAAAAPAAASDEVEVVFPEHVAAKLANMSPEKVEKFRAAWIAKKMGGGAGAEPASKPEPAADKPAAAPVQKVAVPELPAEPKELRVPRDLEEKLKLLDPEKAEKFRSAWLAKAKRDAGL